MHVRCPKSTERIDGSAVRAEPCHAQLNILPRCLPSARCTAGYLLFFAGSAFWLNFATGEQGAAQQRLNQVAMGMPQLQPILLPCNLGYLSRRCDA